MQIMSRILVAAGFALWAAALTPAVSQDSAGAQGGVQDQGAPASTQDGLPAQADALPQAEPDHIPQGGACPDRRPKLELIV